MTHLTHARLIALVLCLALALTFACTSDSKDEEPTATASPFATLFASPTVEPGATPVAAVSLGHPLGTRTGMPVVDAVIAAAEARDAERMVELIHYYELPCTEPGIAAVPCPAGKPIGTPVEVFGWGTCEGVFALKGDPTIEESMTMSVAEDEANPYALDPRVYAVVRGPLFPREAIPGEALIVFASGRVASVSSEGLTYLSQMCVGNGEDWVERRKQQMSVGFILQPPT